MRLLLNSLTLSLVTTLFACASPQSSQSEAPALGSVVTEIDPGIWNIHQGHDGDLWFGSYNNGVYRYDGKRVVHYTQADGLPGHQVRDIQEDKHGNIFISTNSGVSKFDGNAFHDLEVVQASAFDEGWRLHPDDVWIVFDPGTGGPCRYDGETLYRLELTRGPAEAADSVRWPESAFPTSGVYTTYTDRRGHLWFGTAGVGLCRYDGTSLSWMYENELSETPSGGAFGIRCIYEDRAGDFWICNTRQRFRFSKEARRTDEHSLLQYERKDGLPDARSNDDDNFAYYQAMTEDNAGSLWLPHGSEVWKYDGERVEKFAICEGAYTVRIYHDREDRLWVGTLKHGLHVFDGTKFQLFEPPGE